jgi:3-dehydro-L-gulonate 2-dehydrogenase
MRVPPESGIVDPDSERITSVKPTISKVSVKVPIHKVKETVYQAMKNLGISEEKARVLADVHTQSSADGVESHGLNRVPRFAEYVQKGWVDVSVEPKLVSARGAAENYDGNLGIGITNALFCADRAVELARSHGIGLVALKNTTHWMRGGTYAMYMADAGFMGMSWINTESVMPLWGSDEPSVGNNPFCIAIPRENGPIILDMAMSQYAYGKLGVYRLAGKKLPYPGGFTKDGKLTDDPGSIEESMRILPTGYWKGSGMALALDLAAALISNGRTGTDMDEENRGSCTGCSQIFIAIDPYLFGDKAELQAGMDRRIDAAHQAHPIDDASPVTYPGERTMQTRARSAVDGVNVDERVWEQIGQLAAGNLNVTDIASV